MSSDSAGPAESEREEGAGLCGQTLMPRGFPVARAAVRAPGCTAVHARASNELRARLLRMTLEDSPNVENQPSCCWDESNYGALNMAGRRTNRVTPISHPAGLGRPGVLIFLIDQKGQFHE